MHRLTNSTIRARGAVRPERIRVHLHKGGAVCPQTDPRSDGNSKILLLARTHVQEDEVNKITVFETGRSLDVPASVVVQLSASSALLAHGYMLAHGVQIVSSQGPIAVPLYKFREGPDLELPYDGIQLVVYSKPALVFQRKNFQKKAAFEDFNPVPTPGTTMPDFGTPGAGSTAQTSTLS